MTDDNKLTDKNFRRKIFPYIALLLSLFITVIIWAFTKNYYHDIASERFEANTEENINRIETRMSGYALLLHNAQASYVSSEEVTVQEWKTYVDELEVEKNYPGIQGLGVSKVLASEDIYPFEQKIRTQGQKGFQFHPRGKRDLYSTIAYIGPMDERNKRAIGYDMLSEKTRRNAMLKARDINNVTITQGVILKQEIDSNPQPGILMYHPVYGNEEAHETLDERRKSLAGFVYAVFRMPELMKHLNLQDSALDYEIYDDSKKSMDHLLYRSFIVSDYHPQHQSQKVLNFYGTKWYINFYSTSEFDESTDSTYPLFITMIGLFIYLILLTLILYLLHNSRLIKEKNIALGLAQEKERDSEQFYQTIFSSVHEAIFVLEDTLVIDCNDMALMLLNMQKKDIVGSCIENHTRIFECTPHNLDHYFELARMLEPSMSRCTLKLADQPTKIVDIIISSLGDKNYNKLVLVIRDITQKLEDERILVSNMRQGQMGEMISIIAHQWRQPLTIVNSISAHIRVKELIKEDSNELLIENMTKIEKQVLYLSETISDFKDFFRPDRAKDLIQTSKVVHNAVTLIDYALKNQGTVIEEIIVHDSELFIFSNELLQVILTLLKNSMDAFTDNSIVEGKIIITIDKTDEYNTITYQDNAGGIPPDTIGKIFQPYFTTKSEKHGTGLGLSMCKMIIEDHLDGSITAVSVDQYTTFTIKLSIDEEGL